jgi:hypothetical protein
MMDIDDDINKQKRNLDRLSFLLQGRGMCTSVTCVKEDGLERFKVSSNSLVYCVNKTIHQKYIENFMRLFQKYVKSNFCNLKQERDDILYEIYYEN